MKNYKIYIEIEKYNKVVLDSEEIMNVELGLVERKHNKYIIM